MKNSQLIDAAYQAIEDGDYSAAMRIFGESLEEKDGFDVRYGLAVCFFNRFLQGKYEGDLDMAIVNAQEAADFYDDHFDVHLMLGQCYATKYLETEDETYRQKALEEYKKSRELASKRPDADPRSLEKRVDELAAELGCSTWN